MPGPLIPLQQPGTAADAASDDAGNLVAQSLTLGFTSLPRTVTAQPGGFRMGAGTLQHMYGTTFQAAPQLFDFRHGSSAAPDLVANPAAAIYRTLSLQPSQVSGDGSGQAAALQLGTTVVGGQVQGVGLMSWAQTSVATPGADAVGGYFVGRSTGAGANGIGMFSYARADAAGAQAQAWEGGVINGTGADVNYYPLGFSGILGIWLHADGPNLSGVGVQLGNPFGQQFDVGIGFNAQVNGGLTGPVKSADLRTDDAAVTVFLVNGSHTNGFDMSGATITGAPIKLPGGPGVYVGAGAPTLSAAQGSLYIRTDGSSTSTRVYVNTNGTTGWTSLTSAT